MTFLISPSVGIKEVDLTQIIPNVSASNACTVGQFGWGPVESVTFIDNENELVSAFGKPTNSYFTDFLCASSFLAYASNLQVVRVVETTALNATAQASGVINSHYAGGHLVKNLSNYDSIDFTVVDGGHDLWIAKYPGVLGNSVGVAWTNTSGYNAVDSHGNHTWPWANLFTAAPAANEFHIVVYDAGGTITGTIDNVLETWAFVSTVPTAKKFDGTSAYVINVINTGSSWLWIGNVANLTGTSNGITLASGSDGATITQANRETGWDLFADPTSTDVNLCFVGGADTATATYVIQDVAEVRKDCITLVSPQLTDSVNQSSTSVVLANILATRNSFGDSSYAVMDSAAKYMYDRYNDVNRWVPLNGDIAGLCANTDAVAQPWFSAAGFNRGNIKNAIKLSWAQSSDLRDALYSAGINPCVAFPLQGPVLYGDKTLQTRPSAFDRINVRRLFIILEKSIATSAQFILFEQNDAFTQAAFVNMIEPFFREVEGGRGITDYKVICDSSNNTPTVVDANEFVASIFIKPTRSINWIQLNFVAVSTGTSFSEVVNAV